MKFDLIDIIMCLGIAQGFLLVLGISRINNQNKNANHVLSLILLLATLMLVGRMLFTHQLSTEMFKWLSFVDGVIFLFGPLTYLYFRRLIIKSDTTYRLSFINYLPSIIHFTATLYLALIQNSTYINLYQNGSLFIIFNVIEFTGIASNFFYLFKNYLILNNYHKLEKHRISYTQNFHKFLFVFLIAIFTSLTFWLFSYINAYYLNINFTYISYQTVWISIPLLIYIVGYFSLKQPELFRVLPSHPVVNRSFVKRLSDSEIFELKKNLERLLVQDKLYLKSDLTLSELSIKLNSSSNDISWLINNEYKSNFYDFINQYRIKEFLSCIQRNDHINFTLLSIAMSVGFNSKSTFNKAFKIQMNTTPSNYIRTLKTRVQVA